MDNDRERKYWTRRNQKIFMKQCKQQTEQSQIKNGKGSGLPQAEKPIKKVLRALFFPIRIILIILNNSTRIIYSLMAIALTYSAIVYICHQIRPVGAPYLMIAGLHILLPFGSQIVELFAEIMIIHRESINLQNPGMLLQSPALSPNV
jgi:hypothetical protein